MSKTCCGNEYSEDHAFCATCGNALTSKNICSKCGTEIFDDSNFCKNCGEPIKANKTYTNNQTNKLATASNTQVKPVQSKNKLIGMFAVGLVALGIFLTVIMPMFNKPIVGKWNAELYDGVSTPAAYIVFKLNNTYVINELGEEQKGKYKIIKNGDEGIIRIIPSDIRATTFEAEYVIEGNVLTLEGMRYIKAKK